MGKSHLLFACCHQANLNGLQSVYLNMLELKEMPTEVVSDIADYDVICIDKDAEKITSLNAGKVPIFEPGLQAMIEKNSRSGYLKFGTDLKTKKVKTVSDLISTKASRQPFILLFLRVNTSTDVV